MKNHINLSRNLLPNSLSNTQVVISKFGFFIFCLTINVFFSQELTAQCSVNFSACPPDQTIIDCDNSGAEKIDWPLVLAFNAGFCSNYSMTQIGGPPPNTLVPNGTYAIIYYAQATNTMNGSIVTNLCQFSVTVVKDNQKPVFTNCPPNITVYGTDDGTGHCSSQAYWTSPSATDNCGQTTIVATNGMPCGSTFNNSNGPTTVSFTSTDGTGNMTNCVFTVTVICLTKTDEPGHLTNKVRISPNPNTGTFSVELPKPAGPGTVFHITDLAGKLVQGQNTEPGSAYQTVRADALSNGLYFLQVVSDGRLVAVEKFVKQ